MDKYYTSSSKGKILIADMDTKHLYFAHKKLGNTIFVTTTDDGRRVTKHGRDTQEYKDLTEELSKRPTQDYLTPIYKYK